MLLHSLEIRNYRSLEHVKLDGLERFNVLIGRNNSGKSAVFGAPSYLASVVFQPPGMHRSAPNAAVLTDHDPQRSLEFDLTFAPLDRDRARFVELLESVGYAADRREELIASQLLRQVTHSFRSPRGQPTALRLTETRMTAEDGGWATIMAEDTSPGALGRQTVAGIGSRANT